MTRKKIMLTSKYGNLKNIVVNAELFITKKGFCAYRLSPQQVKALDANCAGDVYDAISRLQDGSGIVDAGHKNATLIDHAPNF